MPEIKKLDRRALFSDETADYRIPAEPAAGGSGEASDDTRADVSAPSGSGAENPGSGESPGREDPTL